MRIDSQIRANRMILTNRFRVPELNPLFCESRFGGLRIANRGFEAIRANRPNVMKIGVFFSERSKGKGVYRKLTFAHVRQAQRCVRCTF